MKESQRDKPRCSSQIDLYQNCTKTLCNCTLGAYFEREADSPKLLKTLKRRTKEGIFGRDERACKAGALPTELHAQLCIPSIKGGGIELKAALKMRKLLILLKEKCATRR